VCRLCPSPGVPCVGVFGFSRFGAASPFDPTRECCCWPRATDFPSPHARSNEDLIELVCVSQVRRRRVAAAAHARSRSGGGVQGIHYAGQGAAQWPRLVCRPDGIVDEISIDLPCLDTNRGGSAEVVRVGTGVKSVRRVIDERTLDTAVNASEACVLTEPGFDRRNVGVRVMERSRSTLLRC